MSVGDATALLCNLRFHPIEDMLQPGNDPDCRRLAVDVDRLGKMRPLQNQLRL